MKENRKTKYTHRYLARIVIEAETPLAVGSGEKDLETDALVATDSNGMPYIPATSIAGVVRSIVGAYGIFGWQGSQDENDGGKGSEIIFSEAKILDSHGRVTDGLRDTSLLLSDPLLSRYTSLPVRQHVRINDKGTAEDGGLFSVQAVFAGSRFCFEIEMVSDGGNYSEFETVLRSMRDVSFRLGGKTRSGFGKIRIVDMQTVDLDLMCKEDLDAYLAKSSSLDSGFWESIGAKGAHITSTPLSAYGMRRYRLELKPDSFFQFGSGFSDDEVDMTPVKARKVIWTETGEGVSGRLKDNLVLIPASSLKGALAHRVAFHWNRSCGRFADDMPTDDFKRLTGDRNKAVRILFGSSDESQEKMTRGNVIFSDIIQGEATDKVFNHLKIDRFTGGGIEGALFSEKAVYGDGERYETELLVDIDGVRSACGDGCDAEKVLNAFEKALGDVCNGMLPLGGGVNRGHGVFHGDFKLLNEE